MIYVQNHIATVQSINYLGGMSYVRRNEHEWAYLRVFP